MKGGRFAFLILLLMIFIGCSSGPIKRISYVSLDKPKGEILANEGKAVEFSKFLFGISQTPAGVYPYLKEAEIQSGSPVLRNVDVVMRAGFCLLPLPPVFCVTRYSVIVENDPIQTVR
ncbi:LIC10260 family lipoprotein [Leptospira alstonii]|uniref:Lipoprotein n=2 Tax=Leptospira alstonii TaxID=28452 RepID=T0H4E0_9LEPT|nr:hypothetical protein [Leptospira alstonii]EMJ90480.1 putative lipoprotein [Leptospira alstonii serovar Sichuan str. 79601]EQA80479.1 putative lipoprotein [Leptospira alstonii serovar Pingchang str. 80-412]